MEAIKAVIFGIVEGITEWLPISSTGHMILLNQWLPLWVTEEFWGLFLVVIQLGAVLAVVWNYWNRLVPWRRKGAAIQWNKNFFGLWRNLVISCIPAGIVGLAFDEELEELFYNWQTVAVMLVLVGIWFLVVEKNQAQGKHSFRQGKPDVTGNCLGQESGAKITLGQAAVIGLFQLVAAVFPGTSRSGATILGALLLGIPRKEAAEYSFFLAVPVMMGASLLKLVKYQQPIGQTELAYLALGMGTAFVVSLAAIRFLTSFVESHDFRVFGWYRIGLGVLVFLLHRA